MAEPTYTFRSENDVSLLELWPTGERKYPWRLTLKVRPTPNTDHKLRSTRLYDSDEKAFEVWEKLTGLPVR